MYTQNVILLSLRIVFPGRIYGGPQTPHFYLRKYRSENDHRWLPKNVFFRHRRALIYHLFHGKNEETDIPMVAASDPSGGLKNHDSSVEFHDSYPMTDLFFLRVWWFMPMFNGFNGFCCFFSPQS